LRRRKLLERVFHFIGDWLYHLKGVNLIVHE
jgi:hypothetical protein